MQKKVVKLGSLAVVGSLVCAFATSASAADTGCTQKGMTVQMVGVDDSNGTVFVQMADAGVTDSTLCEGGPNRHTSFRFRADSSAVDSILSVLLAAKLSGTKVRVDKRVSTDSNSAYRAYLLP